jgi:hypothetical protein
LSDEISKEVDQIIDFGNKIDEFNVCHDWIKGSVGSFKTAAEILYKKFQNQGVGAIMLHEFSITWLLL